jgi:hypothetical protein
VANDQKTDDDRTVDHSKLGPFSFDRAQYVAALEEARRG